MSLGLARRKELQKRRSQIFWTFIKFILFLAILIGSSYFAFDTGQEIALRSMVYSKDKFELQTADLEKMRIELGNTEAALNKLQKLLPNTDIQNLLLVINQKAADGIRPKKNGDLDHRHVKRCTMFRAAPHQKICHIHTRFTTNG